MKEMRVLVYGINYVPESIGTGKYNTEMSEWLAKQGHNVDVITAYPHYPKWGIMGDYKANRYSQELIKNVQVKRCPILIPKNGKITTRGRILLELSFAISSLRYWLPVLAGRKRRYDIIMAICPPMQIAMLPWLISIFRKIPWIYHIQDLQVDVACNLGMIDNKKMLKKILYRIESFFLAKATRVSTISEAMAQRIHEKGVQSDRIMLFPNWSDIDFVRPHDRLNPIRSFLGVTPEQKLVLYSGNVGKKQGLSLLIEVAEVLKEREDLKFVIVGDGAERSHLEEIVRKKELGNVSFFDLFPWKQVPELLATGDIHVVIQSEDAADLVMPCKLANILAAARVSVVTAAKGTGLYKNMSSSQAALLVPPNDVEAFVDAVNTLLDDKELCDKMGLNARTYAEQCLSKKKILCDFENKCKVLIEMTNN
jgi:colanic acid biosynthesis glycosyl transferase WcaI